MALFNHAKKEINAKIVYYGPALCGKTTNIKHVYEKLKPENRGKLLSLATQKDRTLFFDFLPVELGEIKGLKTRFHLYTVPGQVFYNGTRKMVLKGVDGLVFVADSQRDMMEANLESLQNLRDNIAEYGRRLEDIPYVIQCNKRDLPNVYSMEDMERLLNKDKVPMFTASAIEGKGVLQTMTTISKMVLHRLRSVHRPQEEDSSEKDLGASYRASRKDADRISTPPAQTTPPVSEAARVEPALEAEAPPPPPALSIIGLGRAQAGGGRVMLPVTVRLGGQVTELTLRVHIDVKDGVPVARVEQFGVDGRLK